MPQAVTSPTTRQWIQHDGLGCPLPRGTLVDIQHFSGVITRGVTVGQVCVDADCRPISRELRRWSGWEFSDGGPMAPKFQAYRLNTSRHQYAAVFRSWLDVRELEAA